MTRGAFLKRAVAVALVVAAIWYLGSSLKDNWGAVGAFHWQVNPLLLAASVLAQVLVLVFGVFLWMLVMRSFRGAPVGFRLLLVVWALSGLARYIPGGAVWQLAAASQMAESRGLSRARMVTSLLIHSALAALAAGVVGVLVLPFKVLRTGSLPAWTPWLALLVVFAVHPRVLNGALALLNRITRRELLAWEASWPRGIAILALECANWMVFGGAYWLFLRSLAPFPPSAILQVCGVFSLSFLSGFVSPSGGGLGMRELAMQRLLEPYFPAAVAVLIAAVARLWTIAAELLTALLGVMVAGPAHRALMKQGGNAVGAPVPDDDRVAP
ncbi:MAG TPA: lysylphosphatidylglycerol synthase domain-containing protein [Longimicrobiaceae bacterium]|nr:lysylphosphatidylglycerol synthase domain-containing protein [Longimicrobiaceae bacterium]